MQDILKKYLKSDIRDIEIPENDQEKLKLARALFGYSIVDQLDCWLAIARDYIENKEPKEPFVRVNELSRKDKLFRETFSKLDAETKAIIIKLVNSTMTGIVFSLLTKLDQFDFGELKISLKPKSTDCTEIKISSDSEDLHDELSEWIYSFSNFKDELVEKKENKNWTTYRLK